MGIPKGYVSVRSTFFFLLGTSRCPEKKTLHNKEYTYNKEFAKQGGRRWSAASFAA